MKPEFFYDKMGMAAAQAPADRWHSLAGLHRKIAGSYLKDVRAITPQEASRTGSDGRTIGQVVGHMAEWDRYTILAFGEIMAGVRWPQIMGLGGYLEPEGQVLKFASVDEFNDYQASKQAASPWECIQSLAIQTATTLELLLTRPSFVFWEALEQTRTYSWRLSNKGNITLPCGWYLWMVTLEHEAVEHSADLGL
jgi:hypothetical protein